MAPSKTTDSPATPDIQAQIKQVTDHLIQRCLLEVVKKYNLPLNPLAFGADSPGSYVSLLGPDLYRVRVVCDFQNVLVRWTIYDKAIKEWVATHSKKNAECDWSFLGFIKNTPITVKQIKADKNFRENADISAKASGEVSFHFPENSRHWALFLMVLEDDEKLVFDGDVGTMISIPQVPSLDDISILKSKLKSLTEKANSIESAHPMELITNQFTMAAQKKALFKKHAIESLGYTDVEAQDMADSLEERLNQELFSK